MRRLDAPTWFAVVYTAIMVPLIVILIAMVWVLASVWP